MHTHGAKIMIQATHMGRRSAWHGEHWPHLMSPSGVREPVHRGNAKIIEIEEIRRIISDFAAAAKRVKDAGMDGIEISAAHQHLIDQFWSPRTNFRTDEWGGSARKPPALRHRSVEGRARAGGRGFLRRLAHVRRRIPRRRHQTTRMEGDRPGHVETGLIDLPRRDRLGRGHAQHAGQLHAAHGAAARALSCTWRPASSRCEAAGDACAKHPRRGPGRTLLATGMVDLVGMTRAQIADPHMVIKIRDGREDEIKQCVGANYCIDRQYNGLDVLCMYRTPPPRAKNHAARDRQNARAEAQGGGGRRGPGGTGSGARGEVARSRRGAVREERRRRRSGHAGREAAATRADGGHRALVRHGDEAPRRGPRLGVAADEETIMAEKPDIVVLATGGSCVHVASGGVGRRRGPVP
jgi:hypothetical protein